jgi:hypothetical protein
MQLTNEAVEARKEYYRDWNRRNKERKRLYNASYWERRGKKLSAEKNKRMEVDAGAESAVEVTNELPKK